jgi:hypothetical protein
MIRVSPNSSAFVKEVLDLGIALAAEPKLDVLLERILTFVRALTGAEAGTIYVREGNHLRWAAVQNDFLVRRLGEGEMRRRLMAQNVSLSEPSLCGHVALTGEVVNAVDAYAIGEGEGVQFNKAVDRQTGYVTCSVVALPLQIHGRPILGVMELLNALNDEQVIGAFDVADEPLIRWCAAQAAVAVAARSGPLSARTTWQT